MNPNLIQRLADLPPVLDILFKMSILLTIAWLINFALRGNNPRWRVLLWKGVTVGLILLPLIGLFSLELHVPILPGEKEVIPAPAWGIESGIPGGDFFPGMQVSSEYDSTDGKEKNLMEPNPFLLTLFIGIGDWFRSHLSILLIVGWWIVAAVLFGRTWIFQRRMQKILKGAYSAPESMLRIFRRILDDFGIKLNVDLLCSDKVDSPLLVGIFRPIIVLPNHWMGSDSCGDLPGILTHELTHLKSRDPLWNRLLQVLSIAFWFHPLIWGTRRAYSTASEEVSDAVAATFVGDAEVYSRTLARVALGTLGRHRMVEGIPMARKPQIRIRLELLKQKIWSMPLRRQWVVLSLVSGVLVLTALGGLKLVRADDSKSTVSIPAASEILPQPSLDAPVPLFHTKTMDEKPVGIEDFRGKVTLIQFWSTWCEPCVARLPKLKAAYEKYHDEGFEIISISLDKKDEEVQRYVEDNNIPWIQIRVDGEAENPLCKQFGVRALPSYFLVDRQGILRATSLREELIEALLDKNPRRSWVGGAIRVPGLELLNSVHLKRTNHVRKGEPLWTLDDEFSRLDKDGHYSYFNVPPGTYILKIRSRNGMVSEKGMTEIRMPVEIGLWGKSQWLDVEYKGGSSSLKVNFPGFYVVLVRTFDEDAKFWIHRGKHQDTLNRDNKDIKRSDTHIFENLPPGSYEIAVVRQAGDNILVERANVDLRKGERTESHFQVKEGKAGLEGQITGCGDAISDVVVLVRKFGAGPVGYASLYEASTWDSTAVIRGSGIRANGTYSANRLPAGKYTLTAVQFPKGQRQYGAPVRQVSKPVELRDGQTVKIDFNLLENDPNTMDVSVRERPNN